MSYGTHERFKSKKALAEAVKQCGAENVGIYGTSAFGNETAKTVADLAHVRGAVIVGPDVERDRRWYANVAVKADGTIVIK